VRKDARKDGHGHTNPSGTEESSRGREGFVHQSPEQNCSSSKGRELIGIMYEDIISSSLVESAVVAEEHHIYRRTFDANHTYYIHFIAR
jgi:hypothetical protein